MAFRGVKDGVICFYVNSDDMERHRRVIQFMLDNNLIKKLRTGDCIISVLSLMNKLTQGSTEQILMG